MKRNFYLKMKPEPEVGGYSAGGAPATKVPPPPPVAATPPPPAAPAGDDNLDEFGYEKNLVTPAVADVPAAAAAATPPTEVAGYGIEPVKADPPPATPPAPREEIKLDYELDAKDLDAGDVDPLKKFALEHKLPKEAAQALLDMKKQETDFYKSEVARLDAEKQTKIAQQKASWDKELRDDPVYGKEQFAHTIQRADKVLSEMMPETKKALTASKGMLPPYVMRDLVKVYNHMYGTDNLVQGDAQSAKEEETSSPLDFYKHK